MYKHSENEAILLCFAVSIRRVGNKFSETKERTRRKTDAAANKTERKEPVARYRHACTISHGLSNKFSGNEKDVR